VFVNLNTPGAADGQLAAWIDGEQKLFYDGRQFRGSSPDDPAPSTAAIDALLVTGHFGGQTCRGTRTRNTTVFCFALFVRSVRL
jgi:hypothetical protein